MDRCGGKSRKGLAKEKVGKRYQEGDMRECGVDGETAMGLWRAKLRAAGPTRMGSKRRRRSLLLSK